MSLRLYGRAPRTGPPWYCRLWHWRRWELEAPTTGVGIITPARLIRCPVCGRSFTVRETWAARASR